MTGDIRDAQNQPALSPPPSDLRHVTSNPALLSASPPRRPQQLFSLTPNTSRGGSRSPTSIPSSPTSIHSSSSAIFERDIEPLLSVSPLPYPTSHHPLNPHRTPRSKATEQLEHAVPSVLAEAASALAASPDGDISIIAPASGPVLTPCSLTGSVGSRSPPLRSRSPSPSPPSRKTSLATTSNSTSSAAAVRPLSSGQYTNTGPLSPSSFSSPSRSPVPSPSIAATTLPSLHPEPVHTVPAHQKRLSFISYSDLLASTPITALPLSSFTAPSSAAPPPHLPAVAAAAAASGSPAPSQGAPSRPLSTYSISTGLSGGGRAGYLGDDQGVSKRLKDDIGGEWEREGFGKGLEERLEELMVGKA